MQINPPPQRFFLFTELSQVSFLLKISWRKSQFSWEFSCVIFSTLYDKWANSVNYCKSYLALFLFTSVYSSASHWQCNSQINYQHFNLPFRFYAYGHGLRHMFHKCLKDRFPRWHCHIVPWSGPKVRFGHSVSHRCMKIQEVFPCLSSQQKLILSLLDSCCSSFFRKGTLYKSDLVHYSSFKQHSFISLCISSYLKL